MGDDIPEEEMLVSWDDSALEENQFVDLENGVRKKLVIKNFRLVKTDRFGEDQVEFRADVVKEDDQVVEKQFYKTSKRLIRALKPVLDGKNPKEEVSLSIKKIGEKFNTAYDVEAA